MPILRTIGCLLLVGLLAAPVPAQTQTQTMTRAQVDAMLSVIDEPGFIDALVEQMNLPLNVRPHAANHLTAIWANRDFRRHVVDEIAVNQAILTDATGALSGERLQEFTALVTETLFSSGLQAMRAADIGSFLDLSARIMRSMSTQDCIALASGRLSATRTQALEMQGLGTFPDPDIARYFQLLRAGVLAAVTNPSPGPRLSASQEEFAERALGGAIDAAISKRPDAAQLGAALMSMDHPSTAHHCEIMIMIIEESARLQGHVGDWTVRWFAQGMVQ